MPSVCGLGQHSWYSNSLQAGQSRVQILVGATFSTLIQIVPGAYPASCTMGTGSVYWRESSRGMALNTPPPPSISEVKERVQPYSYTPPGPSWPVTRWTLSLPSVCKKQTNKQTKNHELLNISPWSQVSDWMRWNLDKVEHSFSKGTKIN